MVALPKNPNSIPIGESRSQALKHFLSLERSLATKGRFIDFDAVMQEYLVLKHAELIPPDELKTPLGKTFYLPMYAVYKSSSMNTKIRAVFDASAKSSTRNSLNYTLLIGPIVHPQLIDDLLRLQQYLVALTADVS